MQIYDDHPMELGQVEFKSYIKDLGFQDTCKFMIPSVINLCSVENECPYKGKDEYVFKGQKRRECKHQQIMKFRKILGKL